MSDKKVSIYKNNGALLGYFIDPEINQFAQDEYEIKGIFNLTDGSLPAKLDFNPQALPYWGQCAEMPNMKHQQLTNIYVQRGRQPVVMTALGTTNR